MSNTLPLPPLRYCPEIDGQIANLSDLDRERAMAMVTICQGRSFDSLSAGVRAADKVLYDAKCDGDTLKENRQESYLIGLRILQAEAATA